MNWIYRLVALADSESLCRRWEMGDHMLRTCAVNKLWMLKSLFIGIRLELFIFRSTLQESRPNKASLKRCVYGLRNASPSTKSLGCD